MSDTAKRATIYDLGYKRYVGTRRPQSTRWRVLVRNLMASAWSGWWRYKIWLAGAAMITVGVGVGIHLSRQAMFKEAMISGQVASWADALVPMSIGWYSMVAFVTTLTVLAGVIPRDLKAGAFQFYFSRPVRPMDYVLGKLAGAVLLLAPFFIVGPFLLSLYRLGLSSDDLVGALPFVPKALLAGTIATIVTAALPVGFGALLSNPKHAIGAWALFKIMIAVVAAGVAHGTGIDALAAIDPGAAVEGLAMGIFEVEFMRQNIVAPMWAAAISAFAYTFVAIALVSWRVKSAHSHGLGGRG